ncbi:MAG: peptidoglycan-binding protein, partial [Opitutaceae bacterium]
KFSGNRSDIMLHLATSGKTLEQLRSSGCLVVASSEWPALRDSIRSLQRQGIQLVAVLAPDGQVTIKRAADVGGKAVSPQEFITQSSLLKAGATGSNISDVQKFLADRGYDPGNVDGRFGDKTAAAVKDFQRANGLEVDGIIGPQTMGAMVASGFGTGNAATPQLTNANALPRPLAFAPEAATTFTPSSVPTKADLASYIATAAADRNIDPTTALTVAQHEGLNSLTTASDGWQSLVRNNGVRETSYGPFQLKVGNGGLGDVFSQTTGLDPSNPLTAYAQVDFALDHAARNGWGSWYGAKAAGIEDRQGLDNAEPLNTGELPQLPAPPTREQQIRTVQQQLTDSGFPVEIDGVYGPHTARAVRDFQTAAGLKTDGVVGPDTQVALASASQPQAPLPQPASPTLPKIADSYVAPITPALPGRWQTPAGLEFGSVADKALQAVMGATGAANTTRHGEDLTIGGNPPRTGIATVLEPTTVPAGPYGADRLVNAAMTGDAGALRVAMDNVGVDIYEAATAGGQSIPQIKADLSTYLDRVTSEAPGAVRAVQSALTANPGMRSIVAPFQGQLESAFQKLPSQQTVTMPLPVVRPQTAVAQTAPAKATPSATASTPDISRIADYRPWQPTAPVPVSATPTSWTQTAANAVRGASSALSGLGSYLSPTTAKAVQTPSPVTPTTSVARTPEQWASGMSLYRPNLPVAATAVPAVRPTNSMNVTPIADYRSATPAVANAPVQASTSTVPKLSIDDERQLEALTGARVQTVDELLKTAALTPPKVAAVQSVVPVVQKPVVTPAGVVLSPKQAAAVAAGRSPTSTSQNNYTTPSGRSYDTTPGVHGSYVVSSSGTIMSPSEYVSSFGRKHGGRLTPYRSVHAQ